MVSKIGSRFLENQINHQPGLVKSEIVEFRADKVPGEGSCPVTADDITCPSRMLIAAGPVPVFNRYATVIRLELGNLAFRPSVHTRETRHAVSQDGFEIRLMKQISRPPAHGRDAGRPRPIEEQFSVGRDEAHPVPLPGNRFDPVRQAEGLKNPHDLAIEGDRARQVIGCGLLLEDHCVDSKLTEHVGKSRSDGAETDYRNVT